MGNIRLGLSAVDLARFRRESQAERALLTLKKNQRLFEQGDPSDAVFYIQKGTIRVTVVSPHGKEATVALLEAGAFVGEQSVSGSERVRVTTATALAASKVLRIGADEMKRLLQEEHTLTRLFVAFLLERNARVQADLVDQLLNSSEKRLARALVLLAHLTSKGPPEVTIPKISQEVLAEMIGTTRSRVNFFMNRFRKLGFIEYNGVLTVHASLLSVILQD